MKRFLTKSKGCRDVCLVMKKSTTGPQCTQTSGGSRIMRRGFGRGAPEKILRPRPLSVANHAYFHAFIRASAQVVGLYELIQLLQTRG